MHHPAAPGAANPCSPLAGPLLKLHWYVYSMATPVNYKLTLLDTTTPEEPPATANPAAPNMDHQSQQPQPAHRNSSSSTGTINQAPDVTVADGAVVSFSGSGFVHMEKNWGAAFPEQWAWAQGISGDGQVSCCCCYLLLLLLLPFCYGVFFAAIQTAQLHLLGCQFSCVLVGGSLPTECVVDTHSIVQ
jgi:hypothetical protein